MDNSYFKDFMFIDNTVKADEYAVDAVDQLLGRHLGTTLWEANQVGKHHSDIFKRLKQ